jgi:hypothetical protein
MSQGKKGLKMGESLWRKPFSMNPLLREGERNNQRVHKKPSLL